MLTHWLITFKACVRPSGEPTRTRRPALESSGSCSNISRSNHLVAKARKVGVKDRIRAVRLILILVPSSVRPAVSVKISTRMASFAKLQTKATAKAPAKARKKVALAAIQDSLQLT